MAPVQRCTACTSASTFSRKTSSGSLAIKPLAVTTEFRSVCDSGAREGLRDDLERGESWRKFNRRELRSRAWPRRSCAYRFPRHAPTSFQGRVAEYGNTLHKRTTTVPGGRNAARRSDGLFTGADPSGHGQRWNGHRLDGRPREDPFGDAHKMQHSLFFICTDVSGLLIFMICPLPVCSGGYDLDVLIRYDVPLHHWRLT